MAGPVTGQTSLFTVTCMGSGASTVLACSGSRLSSCLPFLSNRLMIRVMMPASTRMHTAAHTKRRRRCIRRFLRRA